MLTGERWLYREKGFYPVKMTVIPRSSSMGRAAAVARRVSVSVGFWFAGRVWRCGRGSTGLGVWRSPVVACLVSLVWMDWGGAIAERLRETAWEPVAVGPLKWQYCLAMVR